MSAGSDGGTQPRIVAEGLAEVGLSFPLDCSENLVMKFVGFSLPKIFDLSLNSMGFCQELVPCEFLSAVLHTTSMISTCRACSEVVFEFE